MNQSLTTPKIPNRVKLMLTMVGFDTFTTGRIELMLKTGLRASSREGGSGWEQFDMKWLHEAVKEKCNIKTTWSVCYLCTQDRRCADWRIRTKSQPLDFATKNLSKHNTFVCCSFTLYRTAVFFLKIKSHTSVITWLHTVALLCLTIRNASINSFFFFLLRPYVWILFILTGCS